MLISIILAVFLLYVAYNTKIDGNRLEPWMYIVIVVLTLCSWQSAIIVFGLCIYGLYKGVNSGQISTLEWIEKLINNV